MEVDSNLSSLLHHLKLDAPWIPPKTWESIPSESGGGGAAAPTAQSPPPTGLSTISESLLVRLLSNALHGIKSALLQIDNLAAAFISTPADRTSNSVPTLWCRSSSTSALGSMLRSIARSGTLVFLLRSFVSHYLRTSPNSLKPASQQPPYSLVNQAFAVAVGKVLEGYYSALNTLSASVKVRRSGKGVSVGITILEVYLHTKELRTNIESLANVCLHEVGGVDLRGGDLAVVLDGALEFDKFPRGVDLLTYLYVQLRDADPVHCGLLKFLFVRSCEPYCAFIKSWIYQASSDDPFQEFFIVSSDNSPTSRRAAGSVAFSLAYIEEQKCISVPCFLKDFCRPLLRAGQQLQVLVKLLNLCSSNIIGAHMPCNLENLADILPLWPGMSSDSVFLWNPISFDRKRVEAMILEREAMYQSLLEKLQSFFAKLNAGNQQMNQNVTAYRAIRSMASKRKGANVPFPLVFDEDLNLSPSGNKLGTTNLDAGHGDVDASTMSNESLFEGECLKYSDCSSTYSSEEEIEHPGATWHANESVFQNISGAKRLFSSQYTCHGTGESLGPASVVDQYHGSVNLNEISPDQSGDTECIQASKTSDMSFQSYKCWPLGGLLKNPFCSDMQDDGPKELRLTGFSSICTTDGNTEALKREDSYLGETSVPFNFELDLTRRIQIMNGINKSLSSSIHQPSNYQDYYDLSMNPMLAKPAWLHTVRNSRDRSSDGHFFPNFDFSSVVVPGKANSENIVERPDYGSPIGTPEPLDTIASAIAVNETYSACVQNKSDHPQSVLSSVCSSRKAKPLLREVPLSASGGENCEELLNFSGDYTTLTVGDTAHDFGVMFEIPLDIIIDKCILQEIMLQYTYVSNFTIKLLEEGFDLHEHLLALRRYHFMELADWADSFIITLCNKKWLTIEPEKKIAEIQGLLDMALQRSSCENDHYKERLFVLTKGDSKTHHSICSTGVHAFDFIMLGYKVDWPVSIIVSQDALTTYAEIFTYLIQVRLAVFSLNDAWRFLKAIQHSTCRSLQMCSSKLKDFNVLIKIRQQMNHFVSTLQQYVHSQLSGVSWCRFQNSLNHQVKDMLDLESVHARYLADALHICFLSAKTEAVAVLIRNILQCALDFWLCLKGSQFDYGPDDVDLDDASTMLSQINFSQVFAVKTTFEKNLKDLYLLYLKSPKHGEFGIFRFWSYLNHNNYYSTMINKDIDYFYL